MPTSSDIPFIQPEGDWKRVDRHGAAPAIGSRVAYKSEGHLYAGTLIEYKRAGDPMTYTERMAIVRSDNPWHVRMLDHFTADLYVPA